MSLLRWYTPYPNPVNKYVTSNHAKARNKVPDNPNINPFQIRGFWQTPCNCTDQCRNNEQSSSRSHKPITWIVKINEKRGVSKEPKNDSRQKRIDELICENTMHWYDKYESRRLIRMDDTTGHFANAE